MVERCLSSRVSEARIGIRLDSGLIRVSYMAMEFLIISGYNSLDHLNIG